jgi:Flp pilus assembly protein TadG
LAYRIGPRAHGESVIRWSCLRNWITGLARFGWRADGAAQLVEFAVSLPLLVVFVVGIFDFSNAFTLKQKFTNVARDAARAAAADPANDLQLPSAVPMSVADAFQVVDSYLLANKINDCGITTGATRSGLTWTFTVTASSGSPCGIKLIINRGYYFPVTGATLPVNCASQNPGAQTAIIGTCVSIQYNYPWRFKKVASLLGPTVTLPPTVYAVAVAMNEN